VLRGAQGFYVYVVEADNTVSTRVIQPGVVDGDWMAVEGAVQPGEKVVVDGVDRLRNGAKVEVIVPTFKGGNTSGTSGKANGKSRGTSEPGSAGKGAAEAGKPRANRSAPQDQPGAAGAATSDVTPKPSVDSAQQAPATGAANGTDADGERRRAFFQSLSQEERDKLRAMSPEERQAWREKMRQQRGGQFGGGATN
jgi:multidrug efflux system membrane fusion protein